MPKVTVEVIIHYENQVFHAHEDGVSLTEDSVQIAASGLAYGLVEDVWGAVVDE